MTRQERPLSRSGSSISESSSSITIIIIVISSSSSSSSSSRARSRSGEVDDRIAYSKVIVGRTWAWTQERAGI